ncbi:hypothetical protein SAMN00017405_0942 [Desulfonispora thiosulfatigenes DSM 11270]|uniref:Uncharacterized protein n=1 Tax=Desulfonispora thiosulfatigenes DSM 11270 TaxID=656914 RepID=A0A1W1UNC1_DESTI|nr:hypothetical protein [Desulfonispora thiosulfatigenes]SMB82586.1 hypothetical protein SAMN00017405_0942 [Desulfonispora thiosulfatigenes DSM 11270]
MKRKVTNDILTFLSGSNKSTTEIENYGLSKGYTQEQVLGGIGHLRSKRMLKIVRDIYNPITLRKEHIFNLK